MILYSGDDFAREVDQHWAGREVTVSKTTPAPGFKIRIEGARMAGWEDMHRRIQAGHDRGTRFLVVAGSAGGGETGEGKSLRKSVVIPVDQETAYDVRSSRLLVITGQEVVQFSSGGSPE